MLPEYRLDRTITSYYRDIAKYQISLSSKEEEELFKRYENLRKKLRLELLSIPEAISKLEAMYWETILEGKSPVKMTNKFNTNIAGQNKRIASLMEKAAKSGEWTDIPLTFRVCLASVDGIHTDKLDEIRNEINEIEDLIVRSALQAGVSVAHRYASKIFGVDMKDAVQEANEAILESMETYDVNYRNSKGKRTKFLTYAYQHSVKKVKELIMKQSRLVKLPRHKLDVIFVLIEASKEVDSLEDLFLLAKKCNAILQKRKNRELKASEIVTEESLLEAIKLLQGSPIHLDQSNIFTSDEPARPRTIGEMIVDEGPNSEDLFSLKSARSNIEKILQKSLPDIEFLVIKYRYLDGHDRSLEEVKQVLIERHDIDMTRQRVNQIEVCAFNKLRKQSKLYTILKETIFC